MKTDKMLKTFVAELKNFPKIKLERVERNNHFKLYLDTPSGKQILVVSITTSDGRAMKNNKSILKKWSA